MQDLLRVVWMGALLPLLLSACALGRPAPAPALFDLGPLPPPADGRAAVEVQLQQLTAPSWLAGSGIAYRLDYQDAFRREIYRDSRWVAPPAALLSERLRQRAAQAGQGATRTLGLRLELEEFVQIFATPTQSRVSLRLRSWRGEEQGQGQLRVFELSRPAPSADAAGAVQGLSQLSDELIDQVLAWAAQP